MNWYYKLLANRPQFILLFVATFCIACIVVSFTKKALPNFTDPTLGFEARGTVLSQRLTAWRNIEDESRLQGGKLSVNPYEYYDKDNKRFNFKLDKLINPPITDRKNWPKDAKKKKPPKWKAREAKKNATKKHELDNEFPEDDDYSTDAVWIENGTRDSEEQWEYGQNVSFMTDDERTHRSQQMTRENWSQLTKLAPPPYATDINTSSDGFFCENPNPGYSHFVMERINHNLTESLFEVNALLAMCDLEQRLVAVEPYTELCVHEARTMRCCRPWSIPNYVALLSNRTHCFDITAEDVAQVGTLLAKCFPYYMNLHLDNDCAKSDCKNAPAECTTFNAVYNIFHYFADLRFMRINSTGLFLRHAVLFVPLAKSTKILPYYHALSQTPLALRNDLINIPAMDLGLKNALFDECLIKDGWWILASGLFVLLCMCLYTSSLCITLMTIVAIGFSLGVSYFIYTFVFRLTFFPFMNILAVIVIIGIGADDAFIFIKMWQCAIAERAKSTTFPSTSNPTLTATTITQPRATVIRTSTASTLPMSFCGQFWRRLLRKERGPVATEPVPTTSQGLASSRVSIASEAGGAATLTHLLAYTLRSAGMSMLVTSLTTAAAFYASVFSSITAVRCFGIFAGTAVLVNYVLMMTWLPATVSLGERLSCWKGTSLCFKCFEGYFPKLRAVGDRIEKTIVRLIMCVPWVWISLFGGLGMVSAIVVFHWPGLQLPSTAEFRLFAGEHSFERYNDFKRQFWFEKNFTSPESFQLPLRFVWGVHPVDQGNYLNPASRGSLSLDDRFKMSAKESQQWLLKFCKELRQQPFYQASTYSVMTPHCFIEKFYEYMTQRCYDGMSETDREPCCETSRRPYEPAVFNECLPVSVSSLYSTPRHLFVPGMAGPKFRPIDNNSLANSMTLVPVGPLYTRKAIAVPKPPEVIALVVEYESTQSSSRAYTEIREFVDHVEKWFQEQLQNAPPPMKNGFFISELDFYDLQHTLSQGTWIAVSASMVIALVVLFLVTLNVLISVYAILTVTFTICATVAVLVIIGWELNVLESVAVSTIIGLAVDFSLHYGVHYGLAPERSRAGATRFSLSRMVGPTAMAALTTAAAGAFMLPSSVLAYIQIGVFLIVVMTMSWLYSTFFLMSLLYVLGPEHNYGQFRFRSGGGGGGRRRRARSSGGMGGVGGGVGSRPNDNNSPINPVSEQLLSMSSSDAGEAIQSESHEMESLTSESVVKPPNQLECNRPINFDRALRRTTLESTPSTSGTQILPEDS